MSKSPKPYQHPAIQDVHISIQQGNPEQTVQALEALLTAVQQDHAAVDEITDPAVINQLHTQLIDQYHMPPRSMMLRNRVPRRASRARLFVQAMLNGMRHRAD